MRNTIAWSHDLLAPDDRVLLRRLTVCSAGFTLDAAARDCNAAVDPLEGLSPLVAAGLVRRIPGPAGDARFGLPVTIREYAGEQLDAMARPSSAHPPRRFYRDLAEAAFLTTTGPNSRLEGSDRCRVRQLPGGDGVGLASDDWETAIRLAGAVWRNWWAGNAIGGKAWTERIEEGLGWIERTLPHREDCRSGHRRSPDRRRCAQQ